MARPRFSPTGVVRSIQDDSSTSTKNISPTSLPPVITSDPDTIKSSGSGGSRSSSYLRGSSSSTSSPTSNSLREQQLILEQQQRRLAELRRNMEAQRRYITRMNRLKRFALQRRKQNVIFRKGKKPYEIIEELERLEKKKRGFGRYYYMRKPKKKMVRGEEVYYLPTIKPKRKIKRKRITIKQRRALLKNLKKARRAKKRR